MHKVLLAGTMNCALCVLKKLLTQIVNDVEMDKNHFFVSLQLHFGFCISLTKNKVMKTEGLIKF